MLENLKIVELASVLAGPLVGSFFAELGASVIKIENKTTNGDITRSWKLASESNESPISAYYCAANYGKEIHFLNLKEDEDYNYATKLIKDADIVLSNFTPSTGKKLKLTYEDLKVFNRNMIFAELLGFGDDDSRPAYDVVLQAESGFMFMNGEPGRMPAKMPVALIDVLAAHHLKEAILIGLLEKSKSGEGKHICISLYECALASLANQATNWLMAGHIPQAMGTQHPNIAPYGDMYTTKDGKLLVLAIGSDQQFKNLCSILNIPLDGFATNTERIEKRNLVNTLLQERLAQNTAKYWSSELEDIPHGIVKNMKEVFDDKKAQKMLLRDSICNHETVRVKTALT